MTRPIILLQDQYTKIVVKGSKIIINNHVYMVKEVQDLLAEQYQQHSRYGQLTLDDLKRYNRLEKLDGKIKEIVTKLYKTNTAVAYNLFKEVYIKGQKGMSKIITDQANIKEIPAIRNPDIEKALMREINGIGWTRRLTRYSEESTRIIQDSIREGLANGKVYESIANDIKEKAGKEVSNTIRIVRTESNRVWNEGKINAGERLKDKVPLEKTWLTAADERVRSFDKGDKADHVSMHLVTIPYDDLFMLPSGYEAFAPGHSGNPADDIGCRCILEIRPILDRTLDQDIQIML